MHKTRKKSPKQRKELKRNIRSKEGNGKKVTHRTQHDPRPERGHKRKRQR